MVVIQLSTFVVVVLSTLDWSRAQSLCEPNPCGNNTYCIAQSVKVISCRCLPGYTQKEDTFEGCIRVGKPTLGEIVEVDYNNGAESNVVKKAIPAKDLNEIVQSQEVTETSTEPESRFGSKRNRPQLVEGRGETPDRESPLVIGFDDSGKAVAESELSESNESNQVRGSIIRESNDVDLSNIKPVAQPELGSPGISRPEFVRNPFKRPWEGKPPQTPEEINAYFPEECLVNEDCPRSEYCNQKKFQCEDPCNLNVCGKGSECKVQLNRPVCYCPMGFEGSPYSECTKIPSRVGLRFRRSTFVDVNL
ncbi:uncharacterized protein LOC131892120 [Tigriopus californicus]|uniref:uncharacterized protein LOC131892120 n=1 Tax=Tigriopus californicus TaxID=6832 RepID=UPI0027DA3556|nr:uncharacterized protein LOC131892120 [Tigriopus californicus]